jgi:hypothetical protein
VAHIFTNHFAFVHYFWSRAGRREYGGKNGAENVDGYGIVEI